jgi:hypothetical protein
MDLLKYFIPISCLALLLLLGPGTLLAANSDLQITEMTVTTKIVRGNPIDSVHRISSASVKALYCFTRLQSATGGKKTIRHIWYRDNVKVAEYELPVRDKRWRTYSKKMIEKGMSGDWRVDALDSEGHILKTVKFRMN